MSLEIDKRIPIALIMTLAVQTAGVAFWLGQQGAKISQLEAQMTVSQDQRDRLIAIEVKLEGIQSLLKNRQ